MRYSRYSLPDQKKVVLMEMFDKHKSVILGIIGLIFLAPSMILTWQSGWIEIFDSYFLFFFGVYSLFTNRFLPLGISNEGVFEPIAFLSISISWLLLGFTLAFAYKFLGTDSSPSPILLISILLCFSLQIIIPLLLLSLLINPGILITNYIPVPLPSLIALIGYIDTRYLSNKEMETV